MRVDLRSLIVADSAIFALVGQRVTWGERTQGAALPAILLTKVSGNQHYGLNSIANLASDRVQADCYGARFEDASNLRDAVIKLLSAYSGTQGGTQFQKIYHIGERDLRELGVSTGAGSTFRVSLDFMVHHGEAP